MTDRASSVAGILAILSLAAQIVLGLAVYLFPEMRQLWSIAFVAALTVMVACALFLLVVGAAALARRLHQGPLIKEEQLGQSDHLLDLASRLPFGTNIASGGGGGGGFGGGKGGDAIITAGPVSRPGAVPDIRIRVQQGVHPTGNTASEPFRRWLHLVAENMSPAIAREARIRIRLQRQTTGQDRHAAIERAWMWTGIREQVDLRQGAPIDIPIAIADVDHPNPPLFAGSHEHLRPVGRWWTTPEGHRNLTRHDVLLPGRYWVQVTIRWTVDGASVVNGETEHFLLEIPEDEAREAELIHTVTFERY